MKKIYLNNDWEFSPEFSQNLTQVGSTGSFEQVRIPHSFSETPFNAFSTEIYQKNALYRRTFKTQHDWAGKKILLTIEAAAHEAEVFLNGTSLAVHKCGYTAFTVDLTAHLAGEESENLLAIRVDSHESLNQPPFGFVIDYMTYGGIYRNVYLEVKNPVYIEDVFVKTNGTNFTADVKIGGKTSNEVVKITHTLKKAENAPFSTNPDEEIKLWSLNEPYLYILETNLFDENENLLDSKETRFGFRDIRFDETGFYLNGEKIKIRGLNRHQSFPYVGYAMPDSIQREDADILKYELGLNEVRTSHYPQSHAFVDRCDEIGLLVFTEIPGWQHIGDSEWKNLAVENVREMIIQWRNHPSIFIWGVRINESQDDDEFYTRTNELAHKLDPTRPTGGVRYLKNSNLLEDVYTFNDFSFWGPNEGCLQKKKVTKTRKGYLITEYNGHMFPTKTFDCESHRTEHAIRHAKVLDSVAGRGEIAGSSGWCMADYNTHKDFGSGDYICYHGVLDMFRNPKMAAFVYQSQQDAKVVGDVLEVTSSMDIGEYPASVRDDVYIITNADSVKMFANDAFIKEYKKSDSAFKNLAHPPILIDEFGGTWGEKSVCFRFDAYRDGKLVKTVTKVPALKTELKIEAKRTTLIEAETYDVAFVSLKAVDENGNIQPYCQEAVCVQSEGAIEIIGPKAISLKGGMAGVYVKSRGKEGKGTLVITDWKNSEQSVSFEVKISQKSCLV